MDGFNTAQDSQAAYNAMPNQGLGQSQSSLTPQQMQALSMVLSSMQKGGGGIATPQGQYASSPNTYAAPTGLVNTVGARQ